MSEAASEGGRGLRVIHNPSDVRTQTRSFTQGAGGGARPTDDLERRVATLESAFPRLDAKMDRLTELVHEFGLKTSERLSAIEGRLTGIETALRSKAETSDVAKIQTTLHSKAETSDVAAIQTALRSKVERSDLTPIEGKLGTIDGRVSNLPGIPAMITLVVTTVALSLGGSATLAFTLFKIFKP